MEGVGEAVEVLLSCLCCSADRASWYSSMLVTEWVPIFSRRQRFEASACPFERLKAGSSWCSAPAVLEDSFLIPVLVLQSCACQILDQKAGMHLYPGKIVFLCAKALC